MNCALLIPEDCPVIRALTAVAERLINSLNEQYYCACKCMYVDVLGPCYFVPTSWGTHI